MKKSGVIGLSTAFLHFHSLKCVFNSSSWISLVYNIG